MINFVLNTTLSKNNFQLVQTVNLLLTNNKTLSNNNLSVKFNSLYSYLDLDEEECLLDPRPERLDLDLDLDDELLLEDRERFLRPFDRFLPLPLLDADDLEL